MTSRTQIGTTPKGTPVYDTCRCGLCVRARGEVPSISAFRRTRRAAPPTLHERIIGAFMRGTDGGVQEEEIVDAVLAFAAIESAQTHCKRGHPLDRPENLVPRKSGARICRLCNLLRNDKYRRARGIQPRVGGPYHPLRKAL